MLRRAAEITAEAHSAAMRAARAGGSEHEIEALIDYTFRRRGGTGPGYGTHRRRRRERDHPALRREQRRRSPGRASAHRRRLRGRGLHRRRDAHLSGRRALHRAQRRFYEAVLDDAAGRDRDGQAGRDARPIHEAVVARLTGHLVALGILLRRRARADRERRVQAATTCTAPATGSAWTFTTSASTPRTAPRARWPPGMVLTIEPGLYVGGGRGVAARVSRHRRAHRGRHPGHRDRPREPDRRRRRRPSPRSKG